MLMRRTGGSFSDCELRKSIETQDDLTACRPTDIWLRRRLRRCFLPRTIHRAPLLMRLCHDAGGWHTEVGLADGTPVEHLGDKFSEP